MSLPQEFEKIALDAIERSWAVSCSPADHVLGFERVIALVQQALFLATIQAENRPPPENLP